MAEAIKSNGAPQLVRLILPIALGNDLICKPPQQQGHGASEI